MGACDIMLKKCFATRKYKRNKTLYYHFNSLKQHATKWRKVIEYTHVLQFSLEWRDLSEEKMYC